MTIDDLYKAAEILRRPQPAGYAMHPHAKMYLHKMVGPSPLATQSPQSLMGCQIVEEPSLEPEDALIFMDRDLWYAYLKYRNAQARLKINAPFRFQAYIDEGLIVAAKVRSLLDRQ